MPRPVRVEYEGAVYHVMCRGDRRENIVEDEVDREMFVGTLSKAVTRAGWYLHGYVLMSNHYHLLIETPGANLVRGMAWFQTTFTARHNARHRRNGHVFGGRYKALPVEMGEGYLARLLNYIHLNPARAHLVGGPEQPGLLDFSWSSLPAYGGRTEVPEWLCIERGLSMVGLSATWEDRVRYGEELVARAAREREETSDDARKIRGSLAEGWYVGSEAFRKFLLGKVRPRLEENHQNGRNYGGGTFSDHHEERAREIVREELAGVDGEELGRRPKSDPLKVKVATRLRRETTVPLAWIARELRMGTTMNVSRLTRGALSARISS